jgi:hypothetical protein
VEDRAVGVVDDALGDPGVPAAGHPAQLDLGRHPAREVLLELAKAVAVHPLARLGELEEVVLVAFLVLHRRVHGLAQPREQCSHLVLLHGVLLGR